jgi:hypothetical protein
MISKRNKIIFFCSLFIIIIIIIILIIILMTQKSSSTPEVKASAKVSPIPSPKASPTTPTVQPPTTPTTPTTPTVQPPTPTVKPPTTPTVKPPTTPTVKPPTTPTVKPPTPPTVKPPTPPTVGPIPPPTSVQGYVPPQDLSNVAGIPYYNNVINNLANSSTTLTSWYNRIESTSPTFLVILPYVNVSDKQYCFVQISANSTGNITIAANPNQSAGITFAETGNNIFIPIIGYAYQFIYTQSTNSWWIPTNYTTCLIGC